MLSTFHGLETARRAMMTQQYALHTTGNNIANANTEGYTRQRVNFTQTESYPAVGKNSPSVPGNLGTGVAAGSIQRVREQFLDAQYRTEANKTGYWEALHTAYIQMEDVVNEPSDQGLSKQIDKFWTSLQDLSVDPEDSGARSVVIERANAVAETFNYLHTSLSAIQNDYKNEIGVKEGRVNSILRQIDDINAQIRKIEPHGYVTNDLYDQQDMLLDELSQFVNIKVEREKSDGQPNAAAEGAVSVYLIDELGVKYTTPDGKLIDGTITDSVKELSITFSENPNAVTSLSFGGEEFLNNMPRGEIQALVEVHGTTAGGVYPDMIAKLDTMVETFADRFNEVHRGGTNLLGETNINFFDPTTTSSAKTIKVSDDILGNPSKIAASGNGDNGDGSNARLLANVKDEDLVFDLDTTNIGSYYQGVIGKMAVSAAEAERMFATSDSLRETVNFNRDSVSKVSLDEEMTLMIQFQHAYNAAARNITMVDEMLDRIINGMGIVGR